VIIGLGAGLFLHYLATFIIQSLRITDQAPQRKPSGLSQDLTHATRSQLWKQLRNQRVDAWLPEYFQTTPRPAVRTPSTIKPQGNGYKGRVKIRDKKLTRNEALLSTTILEEDDNYDSGDLL
jgi:hypothetical protein